MSRLGQGTSGERHGVWQIEEHIKVPDKGCYFSVFRGDELKVTLKVHAVGGDGHEI